MSIYNNNLTLAEIFGDKKLRGKLPLISYKETQTDRGKLSQRTRAKSVSQMVYDKAVMSARPYYKPLKSSKNGDTIIIGGITETPLTDIVDIIYTQLLGIKQLLVITANDTNIIRSALKESGQNKAKSGVDTKLYLRVGSLQQLEQMSNRDRNKVINDIMKNIYFSGNFPKTVQKFGLDKMFSNGKSFEQRQREWQREIGQ